MPVPAPRKTHRVPLRNSESGVYSEVDLETWNPPNAKPHTLNSSLTANAIIGFSKGMSKRRRILVWLVGIVVIAVLYFAFCGIQTVDVVEGLWMAHKAPIAAKAPMELTNLRVAQDQGKKLSYLGYEFEVPWQDVDESKTKIIGNKVVIAFQSGRAILLSVVPPQDFLKGMPWNEQKMQVLFKRLYGEEALQSDYTVKRAILETTPKKITLSTPGRDAEGLLMVLIIKVMMVPSLDANIYSVKSSDFEGFQLGDPAAKPAKIAVELYANDGELEFVFIQKGGSIDLSISQPEINRVIQSTHRARPNLATEMRRKTAR
jgi:hypothetical protein